MSNPVDARLALINGCFNTPDDVTPAIREILAKAADDVAGIVRNASKYDTGRLIAFVDAVQLAKDIACCSLLLPHYQAEST
jgi:hypothetical protein